VYIDFTEH